MITLSYKPKTARMHKILSLDKSHPTITAQPDALLMELSAFAEENNFLYPLNTGENDAYIVNIDTRPKVVWSARAGFF